MCVTATVCVAVATKKRREGENRNVTRSQIKRTNERKHAAAAAADRKIINRVRGGKKMRRNDWTELSLSYYGYPAIFANQGPLQLQLGPQKR